MFLQLLLIFKTSKIMAHDENGDSKVGDIVAIEETRPISKNKSWTLNKIIKESQQES
jgi:small subunit ribosomal protein S17